ncbi:hypothetical protein [Methylobacterium fujisawaense]|uniref:hypothetical protein n=1 Tax=Methylobacterium fujisawaense TaxID=107400 RepID=UPI002F350B98
MPTQAQMKRWQREDAEARARWLADEKIRVMRQRALWRALPDCEPKEALRKAMLDQAWELLDANRGEACDALLEFLPESDQDQLLRAFFPEQCE